MSNKNCFIRLYNQINDIEEQIQQDTIKVIPLGVNQKYPNEKNYYDKNYSLKTLKNHKGNLGLTVGYNHEKNRKSLAIIDIDGYTCHEPSEELNHRVKQETANFIYECLKDIPGAMIVQTQSGGKHIYLWNRTITDNIHETSKALHFPDDFPIKELRGESLNQSIEIFTKWKSKQCVLPGSTILIKGESNIRKYSVINDIHNLSDIAVVEDIHEVVRETLIKHGFTYHKPKTEIQDNTVEKPSALKRLTKQETKQVVDLLTPHFKKLVGMKNNSYLCLGGYLCDKVTKNSTRKIVEGLLSATNDDYPKHIKTALSNYERDTLKKGLPSLFENIKEVDPTVNLDKLSFELKRIIVPNYSHSILLKSYSSNKKKYISIDYNNYEIRTYTRNISMDKDEDGNLIKQVYYTDNYTLLNMIPLDIYESYNILDRNASPKICITYKSKGMPFKQTIEGADIESLERQLKKRPGIVLKPKEFGGIINEIIKEYIKLEQIHIVADIPVKGVFINPMTGTLERATKEGSTTITKPSKESVIEGLEVWQKLHKFYKGDKTKLSHILRFGIRCPFSYIFKTEYEWLRLLFLFGVSQTAKTTLGEIALSPYTVIDDEISIGGSSADTEYRMGNALSRQGIGCIINEPSKVIEKNSAMLDLLKRAVENRYCREKMEDGVHVKIPAYSNIIFTSNSFMPKHDAFVRRSEFIEFTKSERMSLEDKELFRERFHHINWRDTDFLKLQAIGDFFIWFVSENMRVLKYNPRVFTDTLLDHLLSYADADINEWSWIYKDTALMDISSSDDDILDDFRNMVLDDYKRNVNKNLLSTAPSVSPDDEQYLLVDAYDETFKSNIANLINSKIFNYLRFKDDDNILVLNSVSKSLEKFSDIQITGTALADLLGKEHKVYKLKGKSERGFLLSFEEFIRLLK